MLILLPSLENIHWNPSTAPGHLCAAGRCSLDLPGHGDSNHVQQEFSFPGECQGGVREEVSVW